MAVMSAGMHDTWILAAERQGCVFFDGKGIDICTERDVLLSGVLFPPSIIAQRPL